jgi:hypothetical protein
VKPSGGARASICEAVGALEVEGEGGLDDAKEGARDGAEAGEGVTGGGRLVPALIAAAWAWKVVETIGQPFPGPLRFCSVTLAALRRASCDALELSSGKEMGTEGLLRTCPAATFAFRIWDVGLESRSLLTRFHGFILTLIKVERSGGQEQGTLMG